MEDRVIVKIVRTVLLFSMYIHHVTMLMQVLADCVNLWSGPLNLTLLCNTLFMFDIFYLYLSNCIPSMSINQSLHWPTARSSSDRRELPLSEYLTLKRSVNLCAVNGAGGPPTNRLHRALSCCSACCTLNVSRPSCNLVKTLHKLTSLNSNFVTSICFYNHVVITFSYVFANLMKTLKGWWTKKFQIFHELLTYKTASFYKYIL